MLQSWDSDGHVEEWEGTFSDDYFDPRFRDRRPEVIDPNGDGFLKWNIAGRAQPFKFGGSPTSRANQPSIEQARLAEWRGSMASAECRSAADRVPLLNAERIAMQVNYPTMLLYWPIAPDPDLNRAITRAYNNWMADVSGQAPERLKWVAVVDYNDAHEAAAEIERCKDLGAIGVMVAGWVGDSSIADPKLEPIWAASAETDLAVAVHPCVASQSFGDEVFRFSVLSGFKHVVTSGLLDRYPKLRVGFLETSCQWVDFMVWRAEEDIDTVLERRAVGIDTGKQVPDMKPDEYIEAGRVYFGFEPEDRMLSYCVERWGPHAWLFASDIPHAHRVLDATGHLLEREDLSDEAKQAVLVDNTARFYGLPVPSKV